ncbi:MAG: FliI/YscN family ATPase [Verrucomicrobia bacterium]|nr:FliI/YscN family ATPase [Verrucomicrobiota bacterium]MBS0645495.1 FliI/YscN family ATPase [Verrucomicrobiota bacterium]
MPKLLCKELNRLQDWGGLKPSGRVTHVIGLLIESLGPDVSVGEICLVYGKQERATLCQVVGFKDHKVLLMPFDDVISIPPGAEVYPTESQPMIPVSEALCGRVLDALGRPLDGQGEIFAEKNVALFAHPPAALSRPAIRQVLTTGIRSIDGLCTLGRGQRIGIFSAPGVGKSTLMGMIAKQAEADINVIALVGERGREVREFIDSELGREGLARSVVIVATSDQTALLRKAAAHTATAIAEYFRDRGKHVLLMMDSVTRFAMALREIGLAVGEPPTVRGYTPSVFAALPALLERAGTSEKGSITGIYTVLSEEQDWHDPIPDHVRSLLDGHWQLSASLREAGHFPPVDILKSLSRLMPVLTSKTHQQQANYLRRLLHAHREAKELISIGAYVDGSDALIDEALAKMSKIEKFLQQEQSEKTSFEAVHEKLSF